MKLAFWRWTSVAAAVGATVILAAYLIDPPGMPAGRDKSLFFFSLLIYQHVADTWLSPMLGQALLVATAMAALGACALALVLAFRMAPTIPQIRLSAAFSLFAVATALFYFVEPLPLFREWIGLDGSWITATAVRFVANTCLAIASWLGLRFFLDYPRTILEVDWRKRIETMYEKAGAGAAPGWRQRLYPAWMVPSQLGSERAESAVNRGLKAFQWLGSIWPPLVGTAIAALGAIAYAAGRGGFETGYFIGSMLPLVFPAGMLAFSAELLGLQRDNGSPDDRRRIDWIAGSVLIGGAILVAVAIFGSLLFFVLAIASPDSLTRFGGIAILSLPMAGMAPFFAVLVVTSFGLSIFYRGAVDPDLAARKITIWGVLAIVVAFLFVLIERTIAAKVIAWLGLSPDSGAIVAGAAVAASIAPIRNHTEKIVQNVAARYLPLDSLVKGERKRLAIAISDLSGFTALSARDEPSAHLQAALLQKQAHVVCEKHGLRMVKSMGDAVMLEAADAKAVAAAVLELHDVFPKTARVIGLEPLAVHSGINWGEVTEAPDGDIYGQPVNLTARIQGEATAGQIACSRDFLLAAGIDVSALEFIGERKMKNVLEPVPCYILRPPLPA